MSSKKLKIDLATMLGIALAFGGIIGGLVLEKGNVRDIAQVTAAIIVFGGTAGAVLVTTPMPTLKAALSQLKLVFFERSHNRSQLVEDLITYATKARKQGIISLENDAESIEDPFLRKALNLAIDGTDLDELKS